MSGLEPGPREAAGTCRICGEQDDLVGGVCEPCVEHEADEREMAEYLKSEEAESLASSDEGAQ